MRHLRLLQFAFVAGITLFGFLNCSVPKSLQFSTPGGASSASSSGTKFQIASAGMGGCNLQPAGPNTLVVVAVRAPYQHANMQTPDVAACSNFCESTGAKYCELMGNVPDAPYACMSFQNDVSYYTTYPYSGTSAGFLYASVCSPGADPLVDARVFDAGNYLARYSDLRSAFGNDLGAAQQHWLNYGIAEGRQGNASFSASAYLARYADVRAAFGNDLKAATRHFVQYGAAEGRDGSPAGSGSASGDPLVDPRVFDVNAYLGRYADLRAAFGSDLNAATQHWLTYGIGEGRQGNGSFLASSYLARYADLRAAFGNDYKAAIRHYVQYGVAEGRSGAP